MMQQDQPKYIGFHQKSSPSQYRGNRENHQPPTLNAKPPPQVPVLVRDVDEMIPIPYYPYSYMNCDYRYEAGKDSSHPMPFQPYFMTPSMPNLLPNYTDVPPAPPVPVFNGRPPFLPPPAGAPEAPQFGPGPPIVTGERLKGPRGCNLFVFHLPNEITNWDLYLLFRRYGTILSVHIMVNKATGLSKGYGFVSFAFADDAQAAIELMDGFRLGKKRLKVQLKRLQDDMIDDEGWEDQGEGEFSRSKTSSNDNTIITSPCESQNTHHRVRKVFSTSSASDDEVPGEPSLTIPKDETVNISAPNSAGKEVNKQSGTDTSVTVKLKPTIALVKQSNPPRT